MIYQQDWLMRQIQSMVQMIARIAFKKDTLVYEIHGESGQTEADLLHIQLRALLDDGQINEAENLLFDRFQANHPELLKVALDFYNRVNALSDEDLERAHFSRDEIKEGLSSIVRIYGLTVLDSTWF